MTFEEDKKFAEVLKDWHPEQPRATARQRRQVIRCANRAIRFFRKRGDYDQVEGGNREKN
jgi:hypothetical protein